MNTYFIRVRQADQAKLYTLAQALGVLVVLLDRASSPTGTYAIAPGRLGCWDEVGEVQRPTGNTVTVDGIDIPETAPVVDEGGVPYFHVNLRIDLDLADVGEALAPSMPDIAAGLADLGRWFVLGEDGKAGTPNDPARVWL